MNINDIIITICAYCPEVKINNEYKLIPDICRYGIYEYKNLMEYVKIVTKKN